VTASLPFPHAPIRHPKPLAVDEKIRLGRRAAEELRFRQVRVSEAFTLQDSEGAFFRASLVGCGVEGAEALVYEAMLHSPESPLLLSLFCAVLARQRMFLVIQKATELGVTRVHPLFSERSVPPDGLDHEKAHAWPGVVLRACKQCRRAGVPQLSPTVPLREALAGEGWTGAEARFYLDDRAQESAPVERGPASAALVVGPEGGWTDAERKFLIKSGARPLALGGRVLRAETAPIVGLALLQHRLGDLGAG
jgi:16S rRNA (uracil1498-N3)-methyltransferase